MFTFTISIHIALEILARAIRKRKEIKDFGAIFFWKNSQNIYIRLLHGKTYTPSKSSVESRMQKSTYTKGYISYSNNYLDETKRKILQKFKYLAIYSIKETKDLYMQTIKHWWKKSMRTHTNQKAFSCSCIGKIPNLLQAIYKFKAIPIKTSMVILTYLENPIHRE